MPFWLQLTMCRDASGKKWDIITDENSLLIVEAKKGPDAERKINDIEFREKDSSWRESFKFCPLGVRGPYNTREEAINSFFVELAGKTEKPGNKKTE